MATLSFSTPTWVDTIISGKIKSAIQERVNTTNANIAEANRQSQERIAELDRQSRETIADADRKSRETVAEMQAAAGITSSVIRIIPPLLVSSNGNSNQSSNDSPLNLSPKPSAATATAHQKADALFPSLEPTFKFSPVFNEVESGTVPVKELGKELNSAKPYLHVGGNNSTIAKWLAIPAIGLAMGAGSKVAFKQFNEDYSFGGLK